MNTSPRISPLSAIAALAALVAGFVALPLTQAGPGIQSWRSSEAAKTEESPKTQSVSRGCSGCFDMKKVDVTTTKSTWSNGRGPIQSVAVGSNQVCQSCTAGSVVMKPAWSNGRGPLQAQLIASSHVCQAMMSEVNP